MVILMSVGCPQERVKFDMPMETHTMVNGPMDSKMDMGSILFPMETDMKEHLSMILWKDMANISGKKKEFHTMDCSRII